MELKYSSEKFYEVWELLTLHNTSFFTIQNFAECNPTEQIVKNNHDMRSLYLPDRKKIKPIHYSLISTNIILSSQQLSNQTKRRQF